MTAMRALKMPRLLVAIFGLMWRYLFVLADEALRLVRARQARSGEAEVPGLRAGGDVAWRARVTGGMAGSLFLRAFERSDRIYTAMLSRGYDGEVRSSPLARLPAADRLVLAAGLGLLLALLALAVLL
jgi:cobalt/nickel transport system permease protein